MDLVFRYSLYHTFVPYYIPIVGVGKERHTQNRSTVKSENAAPVTGTTLRTTGPVPADFRQ